MSGCMYCGKPVSWGWRCTSGECYWRLEDARNAPRKPTREERLHGLRIKRRRRVLTSTGGKWMVELYKLEHFDKRHPDIAEQAKHLTDRELQRLGDM